MPFMWTGTRLHLCEDADITFPKSQATCHLIEEGLSKPLPNQEKALSVLLLGKVTLLIA